MNSFLGEISTEAHVPQTRRRHPLWQQDFSLPLDCPTALPVHSAGHRWRKGGRGLPSVPQFRGGTFLVLLPCHTPETCDNLCSLWCSGLRWPRASGVRGCGWMGFAETGGLEGAESWPRKTPQGRLSPATCSAPPSRGKYESQEVWGQGGVRG